MSYTVPAGQSRISAQTKLVDCRGVDQAECRRQNVTVTLNKQTVLPNGTTISHEFKNEQANGTVFNRITVTHLTDPTEASGVHAA